jgi:sugar-specific transcriptional regulator TrmB
MATDDEFTTRLIGFGLSEKEARFYLYLLKYGPKTPSPLTKSLHTYREDVHRTLTSLIEKGMVRPSLDSPTVYAAVDLDKALDSAVKKHESELREMEARKQELQELAKQQQFRPSQEVSTFKIVKNMKELVGVSLSRTASIKEEHIFVFPTGALPIGALAGITEAFATLVARGVRVRGIVDISGTDASYAETELVQELLDGGADIRCLDRYEGLCFSVSDRKTCVSIINAQRISLSAPIAAIWADDLTYAKYLTSTFELLWAQAVPAAQRIKELLEKRPRTLDG